MTGGDKADYLVVLVRAGDEQTLFFVDTGTPGLTLERTPRFMHDPYLVRPSGVQAGELPGARCEPDSERGR